MSNLNNINNYIFDLDGTIVNSSQEVLLCFKKAFAASNVQIAENRLSTDVIGPPLVEIIKLIAPNLKDETKITEVMQNFRQIYDNDENDITDFYDGIYEFLEKLKKENKKIFLATFKPMLPTMRIVKKLKLDMFDDIYTIDKFGEKITKTEMIEDIIKKYKLKKEETVMIGDAITDMQAAALAGVPGIAALWGYESDKEALKSCANAAVNNAKELECLKLKSAII